MDNQELMKKLEKTESISQVKLRSELPDIGQTERSTESKQDSNPGPGNELKALSELTKQLHQKNATISALQLSVERCNMVRDRPSLNINSPGLNIQPHESKALDSVIGRAKKPSSQCGIEPGTSQSVVQCANT